MTSHHTECQSSIAEADAAPPVPPAADLAKVVVSQIVQAASTIYIFDDIIGKPDLEVLCSQLQKQVESANQDDLASVVAALVSQAATLDTLFNSLARRAMANAGNFDGFERLLRLGLKAQAQSRATLEAVGRIKRPQAVAFVRQANIANGPQQVNNGQADSIPEEIQVVPNELLELGYEQRLDTRAAGKTGCADRVLAPVGALDGAAN